MLKRRTATVAPLMPYPLLDLLLHGEMRSRDARAVLEANGEEYNQLLRFTTRGAEMAALWSTHRQALLDEWIRERPGTRPCAWWQIDAPEPRQRLGGIGETYAKGLHFGMPTCWTTAGLAPHIHFVAIDPNNPPSFESEAAYLARLGLLPDVERRRLQPAAFQPELVLVDEDDNVFVCNAADRAEDR